MNPTGVRRAAALLAVVAAVLGLSGCFKARQDIGIKADGTGSVVLHVEVNRKAIEAIARSFGVPPGGGGSTPADEPFRPVDKTFPDGTKVRAVNTPDQSTLDASFDFTGPDDYGRRLQQVSEAVATDPDEPMPAEGGIVIRRVGDRMEVSLDVGSAGQGMEDVDLSALNGLIDPAAMPSAVVAITMPGSVLSSNGQAKGRTVTWDLFSQGAPSTLTVTSKVERSGLPGWALPAGAGLLLLLLLGLLAFLLSQRRRTARPVTPEVPYHPGPWQPTGAAPGGGTFFPPPADLPPRDPAPSPQQQPPAPSPQGGAHSWLQSQQSQPPPAERPPPSGGAPRPEPVAWPPPPEPRRGPPAVPATEPVATPSPSAPAAEPGWYADPAGVSGARYWDGRQWTEHTR